ncbi:MAG: geranylgeranylglycerol-phosphate geranylgeranyltransferase [Flavobacteriales bacterium]
MVVLAYLKLIRWPILVLIAVIQYATRHFVIEPMLAINGYGLIMTERQFLWLVISTVLIAAGGYAINDYFDAKIDRVNKPKTVVLDRLIPRRVAMATHMILSGIGFMMSAYLSYKVGLWKMSALFIFAIFSLWFYSTNLKNQFLSGNLVIAVMSAFVPLIVGLFEIPMQNAAHPESVEQLGFSIFNGPAYWVMGYAGCIFLLTLCREITKDIIDIRGDKMFGCRTIPIVAGVRNTKSVLIGLYLLIGALLLWVYQEFLNVHSDLHTSVFAVVMISIFIQFALIFRSKTKAQFQQSVRLNNLSVLLVIMSMYLLKLSIESYFI